ncbi:MAG: SDR family oxidoreductase [Rubrobacter sp.]|nr:SDR family oxidoreductase [Rubrobacter sp.]
MSDPKVKIDPTESSYLDAFRLDGQAALITGAGSERGIGREIGLAYAAAGASVGLADVDEDGVRAAAQTVRAAGGKAVPLRMDATDPGSVSAAVAVFERELGPVDILVNSAGISRSTPIWEIGLEEFDLIMGINVRGGFLCLKAVLPGMMRRRRGRVVWLSSVAGKQGGGIFGTSHYAASKAAVIGLCQAAARELGPYGITSNAIAPGFVDTGIVARSSSQELEDQVRVSVAGSAPLRRAGTAKDIACAALYLASDAAAYVTGEILDVNGGSYFD